MRTPATQAVSKKKDFAEGSSADASDEIASGAPKVVKNFKSSVAKDRRLAGMGDT